MNRIRSISLIVAVVGLVSWLSLPSLAQAPDQADAFFNDGVLHEIRLQVNTKDLQILKDHWLEKTYYPADFRWNNQVVRNVGIRSRGQGSRRPNKLSLRVDMNRYTDGQTFLGLKSFILRNTSQDASYMRERLAMRFFRQLGISAVREAPRAVVHQQPVCRPLHHRRITRTVTFSEEPRREHRLPVRVPLRQRDGERRRGAVCLPVPGIEPRTYTSRSRSNRSRTKRIRRAT
jgi:hypothetical protein